MTEKISTFKKALQMLSSREKKTGVLILGLIILKGIGDMISVATVVPFLSLLGNPEIIRTNPTAIYFYTLFKFNSVDNFIMAVGILIVFVILSVSTIRSVTAYTLNRWVAMREYSLSLRLMSLYMRQPYEFFLGRNTFELNTYILGESARVVREFYKPVVDIVNGFFSFILIFILLLWVEPIITLISILGFGICYFSLYLTVKGLLKRMGDEIVVTNKTKFRASGEALGGIKQIKLLGREKNYIHNFSKPAQRQAKIKALNATLRQIPKFVLEAIAFGGIIILTLILVSRNGGVQGGAITNILPTLGLYAFAGYRILPIMQSMYASFATLKFGGAAVEVIYEDINKISSSAGPLKQVKSPLPLEQNIIFEDVSYLYPETTEGGLTKINFEIGCGQTIGLVGTTGAGKTTLVDIFLGLLPSTSGEIIIDGNVLTDETMRDWQASIGYVPQEVFLVDASVSENIAFGIPKEKIDLQAVNRAAASAQILDFIITQMPEGFNTNVGERGVRISGGQRQRIGIARALYHNPEVIVFDEATSALDNTTERELMKEINALAGTKTIVMIAHRLSTVKDCDFILVLDKGRLVGKGTYDELLSENTYFQSLTH